jgi:hypothetical protein
MPGFDVLWITTPIGPGRTTIIPSRATRDPTMDLKPRNKTLLFLSPSSLPFNLDARALPLIHSDSYLNDLLLKYCEAGR